MAQRPHVRALSGIAAATLYAAPVQARNRDCAPLLDHRYSGLSGDRQRWSFHKYLIHRSGSRVHGFPTRVTADSAQSSGALERLLASL